MRQKDCHLSVYRVLQIKEETYKVIGTFISKMNNCRTHEHPSLRPYSTPDYTGHSVNQPIGPFALKSESNKYKPEYTSVYTGNVINRSHWMSLFLLLVECHFPGIWFASCCNKTLIQILKCIRTVQERTTNYGHRCRWNNSLNLVREIMIICLHRKVTPTSWLLQWAVNKLPI